MKILLCIPLLLATLLWPGCAQHKESLSDDLKSREQITYYDRNNDGKVDQEKHHYRGVADADWELRDDDYNGRYEKKILYGFAVTQSAVDIPVPTNVHIEPNPATSPNAAVDPPTKLSLGIEGFLGASYRVELVEGTSTVRYLHNPETFTNSKGTKEEKLTIPKERWLAFRKKLDEANVWNWKKNYEQKGVFDGTVWEVSIDWDGRKVGSRGDNAYPPEKQFAIYKVGVSELLGGKEFE